MTYISCYLSPNEGIDAFRDKIETIEEESRRIGGETLMAGDFNAKALEWGMKWTCSRGAEVTEMAARLDLTILNRGTQTTFRRSGTRGSIIDVTLATARTAATVSGWRVLESYSGSDHQYIEFRVGRQGQATNNLQDGRVNRRGWNVTKLNAEALITTISRGGYLLEEATQTAYTSEEAEGLVDRTMCLIAKSCDASMPRRSRKRHREPMYWWNEEIAELRKKCNRLRRVAQRATRRENVGLEQRAYKLAKSTLVAAIKSSKARCWKAVCDEVEQDIWGRGYQIVTRKFGRLLPEGPKDPTTTENIVRELFPEHPGREIAAITQLKDIPLFTVEELRKVGMSLANRKAPGPDGIPTEVLKIVIEETPFLLLNMFNACLQAGVFSSSWKVQRLVLLDKGKGPPVTPSSYRPLCMLDTAGKVLEKLIRIRLNVAVEAAGGLAQNQHGFREGRSTMRAIQEILETTEQVWQASQRTRGVCVLVTLDVKNAFNTVSWTDILEAIVNRFRVPQYIVRIISDYLNNRELIFDTTEGLRAMKITAGVAQGSALGPTLWNIVYDAMLTMEMPKETKLVGFADDIAAVVTARYKDQARWQIAQVSRRVNDWLNEHKMRLAANKTEMVVLTRQRKFPVPFSAEIVGVNIAAEKTLKYLGVMIDAKLTYWTQIQRAADKASKMVAMLSRLCYD